jgi:ATP-dependent DNA helicase RecG
MEYLKDKIEIPFALADDMMTRTEDVPIVIALREAFVNMLIHRDYFDNTESRIRLETNQIEMYNPGAAPRTVEDILKNEVTAPRNPVIAKAFRIIGWAETAGSGAGALPDEAIL